MNTLPKAITARLYSNTESYLALRRQWRVVMNSDHKHELTAAHHLLYLTACGKGCYRCWLGIIRDHPAVRNGRSIG